MILKRQHFVNQIHMLNVVKNTPADSMELYRRKLGKLKRGIGWIQPNRKEKTGLLICKEGKIENKLNKQFADLAV